MDETRQELRHELDRAYRLISAVRVSGDVVDIVAEIRQRLRHAYELAAPGDQPEEPKEDDAHG